MMDIKDYNVLILGLSFMFIFTAFQTTGMIEESILISAKNESNIEFKANGYTRLWICLTFSYMKRVCQLLCRKFLCIISICFALFIWIAPPIISFFGLKFSMMLSGLCYWAFIFSLYFVSKYVDTDLHGLLYAASAVLGLGGAVLWTAQGSCLTVNSTYETMQRNAGIFWLLLQSSLVIGSLIVYFNFKPKNGSTHINLGERSTVLIVFIALTACGSLFFLLLRKTRSEEHNTSSENLVRVDQNKNRAVTSGGAWESFITSLKLSYTKPMLFLNIVFIYTGLELTFFNSIYGTCVGNTLRFPNPKELIGLSGVFIGIGEMLGGGAISIVSKCITAKGRDSVILLAMLVHFVAFALTLCNFPDESPNNESHDMGYLFEPSVPVAMLCAFLIGFGDSCYNTQVYSLLGNFYCENSASAYAVFNFYQTFACAVAYFYASYLGLRSQLYILIAMAFLASLAFFVVERIAGRKDCGQSQSVNVKL